MASGTITGTTSNKNVTAYLYWSSSVDKTKNISTVTVNLSYKARMGEVSYGSGTFSVTIGNATKSASVDEIRITPLARTTVLEFTQTVNHNADGTMSLKISASGSMPDALGQPFISTTISGTADLDPIRFEATTLDSISAEPFKGYFNETLTYKYTPKHDWLYNCCKIYYQPSTQTGNISTDDDLIKTIFLGQQSAITQTATVTLSEDELSNIYERMPNCASGALHFIIRTYSDSEYSDQIGDYSIKTIGLSIPITSATIPTATMLLSPVSALPSQFEDVYVQGKSKVNASFTNAAAKYGATIQMYNIHIAGVSSNSSPNASIQSGYLGTSGTIVVTGTVKDSRGISLVLEQTITVIPYASPTILPASGESSIVCARCNKYGELSESGTYLKIKAKRRYSEVLSSDVQKNFCSIRYRYKEASATYYSDWKTILASTVTNDEVETDPLLNEGLSASKSYLVQIGVIDTIGETHTVTLTVPTASVYMHRAGSLNSLGIGKYVEEENTIDVAEIFTTKFRGKVIFESETWVDLGLSENVSKSSVKIGRHEDTGCYFRVHHGEKQVTVTFNCAFSYENESIQVNKTTIPEEYRPKRNVCAICATGGRAIARVYINANGNVLIDWIQKLTDTANTTSVEVAWIDGYIDYWI